MSSEKYEHDKLVTQCDFSVGKEKRRIGEASDRVAVIRQNWRQLIPVMHYRRPSKKKKKR